MNGIPLIGPALVMHTDPFGAAAEAFRVLRTNLQFAGLDRPLKRILVTSAVPGEGKSIVAANLAITFAQAGASVCLVDADLRRPQVAELFGVESRRGLSTVMMDQLYTSLQESVVPGLMLLASGPIPPNPAELLGSERVRTLLDELAGRFDVVVVDSPPVLAVTDAAVLAPRTDGVILVAHAGKVARKQVREAKNALEAVQARVLGVVLNRITAKEDYSYGYFPPAKSLEEYGTNKFPPR